MDHLRANIPSGNSSAVCQPSEYGTEPWITYVALVYHLGQPSATIIKAYKRRALDYLPSVIPFNM
jgi:hypothetical protein